MSENGDQSTLVSVVALRAESYSAAGDNIVISLRTKHSTAERKYSIPVECFQDLIVDLRRLSADAPKAAAYKLNTEIETRLPLMPKQPGSAADFGTLIPLCEEQIATLNLGQKRPSSER
jgi:hypothetical protein